MTPQNAPEAHVPPTLLYGSAYPRHPPEPAPPPESGTSSTDSGNTELAPHIEARAVAGLVAAYPQRGDPALFAPQHFQQPMARPPPPFYPYGSQPQRHQLPHQQQRPLALPHLQRPPTSAPAPPYPLQLPPLHHPHVPHLQQLRPPVIPPPQQQQQQQSPQSRPLQNRPPPPLPRPGQQQPKKQEHQNTPAQRLPQQHPAHAVAPLAAVHGQPAPPYNAQPQPLPYARPYASPYARPPPPAFGVLPQHFAQQKAQQPPLPHAFAPQYLPAVPQCQAAYIPPRSAQQCSDKHGTEKLGPLKPGQTFTVDDPSLCSVEPFAQIGADLPPSEYDDAIFADAIVTLCSDAAATSLDNLAREAVRRGRGRPYRKMKCYTRHAEAPRDTEGSSVNIASTMVQEEGGNTITEIVTDDES